MIRLIKRIRRMRGKRKNQKREMEYRAYLNMPENSDNENKAIVMMHDANYGGAPLVGLNMARAYIKAGYEVTLISLRYGPLLEECAKVAPTQVCLTNKELEDKATKLRKMGYSVVICNGICTGTAVPIFKRLDYRVVSLVHELPGVIHELCVEKAGKYMATQSDALIFPAEFVKKRFVEEIADVKCSVAILHQGLYAVPKEQKDKWSTRRTIAAEYGFDPEKPLFINVATINERKGFDLFAEMAARDSESTYLWIGDGIERRFGKKAIRRIGGRIPENLILPGYIKDQEKMSGIYASADFLALTSREEPFGSIVLEAFANSTPVVAFDGCGGYMDIVKPYITGMLVSPFDTTAMIKCLHNLKKDMDAYERMRIECFKVAQSSSFDEYCEFVMKQLRD